MATTLIGSDVKECGTLGNGIRFTTTRHGTTYTLRINGKVASIQLIETNGKVQYRNQVNIPTSMSPQLRSDLMLISNHFSGISKVNR